MRNDKYVLFHPESLFAAPDKGDLVFIYFHISSLPFKVCQTWSFIVLIC